MPERARFSAKEKRLLGCQIRNTSHKGLVSFGEFKARFALRTWLAKIAE